MATHSKLTAQGQVSVPAEVRRRLGLGPGSVIEWTEREGAYLVRRAGRYSSADIHDALFSGSGVATPGINTKEAIRSTIRRRNARR
jgi:AbrB family looped-hinge helix DNA binding protein